MLAGTHAHGAANPAHLMGPGGLAVGRSSAVSPADSNTVSGAAVG